MTGDFVGLPTLFETDSEEHKEDPKGVFSYILPDLNPQIKGQFFLLRVKVSPYHNFDTIHFYESRFKKCVYLIIKKMRYFLVSESH